MTGDIKTITIETTPLTTTEGLGTSNTIYRFNTLEDFLIWYPKFLKQSEIEKHPNFNMY